MVGEPPIGPNLWRSWPYSPDLGSLVDPRLAGCRVRLAAEDGGSASRWAYDARGRATSEHLLLDEGGSAYDYGSRYTWGAEDCMRSSDTTWTSADSTYESHTDWLCDARGNPESTTWVTDGETTAGVTFWNEYDDQGRLVARELTRAGGSAYEAETFTYDGGWLASYATRSWSDEEIVTYWTARPDGLIERYSEERCALEGAEECGERLSRTYTFDGDGLLVSAEWVSRSLWLNGEGRVEVDGETTYLYVYTADERGLPADVALVGDDGATVVSRYTLTCDGPPPPSPPVTPPGFR